MPYIPPEVVEQARQIDLLTYLQSCEPQELVRISGNNYTTRTHDSLKISNGKWMWWSQRIGGYNALDYARMSVNYENEQRTLINKVAEGEKKLACIEQTSLDLKTLLKVLRSSTSFEELTPTLVNSLIRRIEVHNNDKSSGHCYVKVDIYFTAIGLIDIPTEDEIKSLMAKIKANPQEYRLTA